MKIETIDIMPLKMGRVKSTGKLRAISCRLSITWDNKQITYQHVNTMTSGIMHAYKIAQEIILKNMKERGVA